MVQWSWGRGGRFQELYIVNITWQSRVCTHMRTYMCIYIHTYLPACMHAHMDIYIYTHTHTHTHFFIRSDGVCKDARLAE